MLVARRPKDPEALQSSPHLGALLPVLLRQPVAERAVGVTELEGIERLGVVDATALQVGEGFGRLGERPVVEGDHLGQQL